MAARKSGPGTTRLAILSAISLVCVALLVVAWTMLGNTPKPDYRLQTTNSRDFTPATLTDKPSLIFFGYTHCPDVCPTTLGDIAVWHDDLGPDADKIQVFYVTVDPERDTLPLMTDYLSWTDGVIGVTGTRAETDKALRAFQIYARKVPAADGNYTMDHTASVFLFDRNGRMADKIAYQEPNDTALPKLRALIGGGT